MIDLAKEIERLVRLRKRNLAVENITRFLRREKRDPAAIFRACEWYRRLGLYREGFRLLDISESMKGAHSSRTQEGKKLLWAARFLNLLGASQFGVDVLRTLRIVTAEDHRVAGNLLLANFAYSEADAHFVAMKNDPVFKRDYTGRLALVSYADCLYGLGKRQEAITTVKEIASESSEPLLKGIALQAWGEYCARSGQFSRAVKILEEASLYFSPEDTSFDRAVLLKWLGYCHGKLGAWDTAKKLLMESFHLVKKPGARAEAWLDIVRLQGELGFISSSDLIAAAHYPGRLKARSSTTDGPERCSFGPAAASLQIDLDRDEYVVSGLRYLGIPLELKLVAYVVLSGAWGIETERIKTLLWPGQHWAYGQLEARLHQLLRRVRYTYAIELQLKQGVLGLSQKMQDKIQVWQGGGALPPSFFIGRTQFKGQELSQYYALSRTARFTYVKTWIARGWVRTVGKAPQFQYVITYLT